MPTILMILGWRFFFYSNESDEPVHIHCKKGDAEGKFWLNIDTFEVIESHAYHMNPTDRRNVRRIIFEHFDYILEEWNTFQEKKNE
jgi:hypothetical protein